MKAHSRSATCFQTQPLAAPEVLINLKALRLSPQTSSPSFSSQRLLPPRPNSSQPSPPMPDLHIPIHPNLSSLPCPIILPTQAPHPSCSELPRLSHRAGFIHWSKSELNISMTPWIYRIRRHKGESCPYNMCVHDFGKSFTIPHCPPGPSTLAGLSPALQHPPLVDPTPLWASWPTELFFPETAKCWHMLLISNKNEKETSPPKWDVSCAL